MTALGVLLGGGLGAFTRYRVEGVIAERQPSPFPLSTLVINVSGSALLGILAGSFARGALSPTTSEWVGMGFLGGYTTFSTFTYETVRLIEDGA